MPQAKAKLLKSLRLPLRKGMWLIETEIQKF
nr:MAG TPA: hypothetical protein [Caudoviricetes sp.]